EIDLPTKVKGLKSIGLPPNVIYACLAETIVLALEGRFEVFTVGRDTEWEKVKEIYKLGLKHGMKLAAISGVNGVFTDEMIAKVVTLAKKARLTWKGGSTAKPAAKTPRPAAKRKTPVKVSATVIAKVAEPQVSAEPAPAPAPTKPPVKRARAKKVAPPV
ncbi:MAG: dehydrogenase, partial [Rhodoferax sp.]|nr:dehydrogenase [Rhodoferax sp.]